MLYNIIHMNFIIYKKPAHRRCVIFCLRITNKCKSLTEEKCGINSYELTCRYNYYQVSKTNLNSSHAEH